MNILGLHINGGQSSAALLVDGVISAAVAEERFSRVKQSRAFPRKAINFCLQQAGVSDLSALDGIAISWNPAENMRHINNSGYTDWRRYDPEWLYIAPNNLIGLSPNLDAVGEVLKMELGLQTATPIYFVEHHWAHLAHAIYQSPFEKGMAAAVDEYSEFHSVTLATFDRGDVSIIRRLDYPHSLGVFYAAMTEFLGFVPNSEEWKVMGAAAYGKPDRFLPALQKIFRWDDDEGEWLLDACYIEHSNMKRAGYCNERMARLIGMPMRFAKDPLSQDHFDLAASAQALFEERLFQLLTRYSANAPEGNLAAAGGCFMNSLANGKITANTPFNRLFVPYAAADNGGAMGAALYVWHRVFGHPHTADALPPSPYLGPEFSNTEIERTLKKFKLPYRYAGDVASEAANLIAGGKLVGWFQTRMEFGERALGARSILADPRRAEMKDILNSAVKYREGFRPFAPAVLSEHAMEWFDMPADAVVPYMEQVFPISQGKREKVPAVVHADGTGRLQTVIRELNPLFHALIERFYEQTGVPLVINTSFNVQGEPIVCSPADAVRTFFTSGLDVLVIGDFVVCKQS
ncbi:MAG: carbamoyltransferase [Zoogloeaceae bacterium]|nr:carbamoyltransferase [Zoogloeaceae bacterium]